MLTRHLPISNPTGRTMAFLKEGKCKLSPEVNSSTFICHLLTAFKKTFYHFPLTLPIPCFCLPGMQSELTLKLSCMYR